MSVGKKFALLSCAAAALAGCVSMRQPLTDFATDYNQMLGDTRNQMILLNIVRARLREPTHYSALQSIAGSLTLTTNAGYGITGTFSEGEDSLALNPSIGVSLESAPTFQIAPLNTKEFAEGILNPIRPATIASLLAQGWNSAILVPLFVESIRCGNIRFENDPRGVDRADSRVIDPDQLALMGFEMNKAESPATSVRRWEPSIEQDRELVVHVPIEHAGATLTTLRESYALALDEDREPGAAHRDAHIIFGFSPIGPGVSPHVMLPPVCDLRTDDAQGGNDAPTDDRAGSASDVDQSGVGVTSSTEENSIRSMPLAEAVRTGLVTLRSIDGVIYYLGELARLDAPRRLSDGTRLFHLYEGELPDASYAWRDGRTWSVSVEYRDTRYYIATGLGEGEHRDRSIQIISLISQLIALQTNEQTLQRPPSSLTVR